MRSTPLKNKDNKGGTLKIPLNNEFLKEDNEVNTLRLKANLSQSRHKRKNSSSDSNPSVGDEG